MPYPGPGCNCQRMQLNVSAFGWCTKDTLSGVVVTVENEYGVVVAKQSLKKQGSSKILVWGEPGTYQITGVWNGAQTVHTSVDLRACSEAASILYFVEYSQVTVLGCAPESPYGFVPIENATVQCGSFSGTTNSSGLYTFHWSHTQPPQPIKVKITLPTGPSRTVDLGEGFHGHKLPTAQCSIVAPFVSKIIINITGCNGGLPGAIVSIAGPETLTGTTDSGGNVSWIPTVDWLGSDSGIGIPTAITVSKAYFQTINATWYAVCWSQFGLEPLPCYICCGECDDPIPSLIDIVDINGTHQLQLAECGGSICYKAAIPPADAAYDYLDRGSVAVTYSVLVGDDPPGSWGLSAMWPVAIPGSLAESALYLTTWSCGESYEEFGNNIIVPDIAQANWQSCTPPFNFVIELPANGALTPNPVAGPITISDACGYDEGQDPQGRYYYLGGGGMSPEVVVTFDDSTLWGQMENQTITLLWDAAFVDYPSTCLYTGTDGGLCDNLDPTEGMLTVTLVPVAGGTYSAIAQWTGGVLGLECAAGACEYYATATASGIVAGGPAVALVFESVSFSDGGVQRQQVYGAGAATWTSPLNGEVTVECYGGGGAGWTGGGGGGGGGEYARSVLTVAKDAVYNLQGGAGGTSSTNGGASWFNTNGTVLANGGASSTSELGGTGGTGGIGETLYDGGNGGYGSTGFTAGYGGGGGAGATSTGAGAPGGDASDIAGGAGGGTTGGMGSASDGDRGTSPGGGGGGTGTDGSDIATGGDGQVVLTWTAEEITLSPPATIYLQVPAL